MGGKGRRKALNDLDAHVIEVFKRGIKWRKVKGPRIWAASPGDELVGFYAGTSLRDGQFGPYTVAMVRVPRQGIFIVSGVRVTQALDTARIEVDDPVRIVFQGYKDLSDDRRMKLFDVYVEDGPRDLPARWRNV